MRLLILTQYYPPETGAPQNRLHELATRLMAKGIEVEVHTAMPNYPKMEIFEGYQRKRFLIETIDEIKVYRSRIFVKKSSSIFYRLLNYFSFVWSSFWIGLRKLPKYDFIMVESPPLFLGISGYLLSRLKKSKMIFNVSDLWPESAEKLGLVTNKFFLKMATILEEFLYRKATLITGQTNGIVKNISDRFPDKRVYWLPNGVDLSYFNPESIQSGWRELNQFSKEDILFLYAGIIGHAQGLEVILKAARFTKNTRAKFVLVGDGPVKNDLLQMKKEYRLDNVYFFDPVSKNEIPEIVKSADMALVPLRNIPLFEGAIPSKIFENLAMKVPLLLGVDGEAKDLFITDGKAGLFFTPEDERELSDRVFSVVSGGVNLAQLGENGRRYVNDNFNRNNIAEAFYRLLKELQQ